MLTKISRGKKRLFTISVPSSADHLFEREGCLVCISCQTTRGLRINLNDNIQYFELRVETKQIYSTNNISGVSFYSIILVHSQV